MAKRGAMKLLTVALLAGASTAYAEPIKPRVLANARPACGNTGGKVDRPADCTAAETRAALAQARIDEREARRRDDKYRAERRKLLAAMEAAVRVDPSIKARLLIDGRPACGNTMSKKGPPAFCRIGEDGKQ